MRHCDALNIAIDMGSDTLKLTYAYTNPASSVLSLGKVTRESMFTQSGIPAIAFFSKDKGRWLFGKEVELSGEQDFTTVVKIKSLISMLDKQKDVAVWKRNENYYYNLTKFPKFYLPKDKKDIQDFGAADDAGYTFDGGITPQKVCEEFFRYARDIIDEEVDKIARRESLAFLKVTYSIIYPSGVGAEHRNEFVNLIERVFKCKVFKKLSAVKALGVYARYSGMVRDNERFLVFDVGEEYVSVMKAWFENGELITDGLDGHKAPSELGGTQFDEAIRDFVEGSINSRETIGTPSAGQPGHVSENCMDSKKYQLLRDIKDLKYIFSGPVANSDVYGDGVPLLICRDCYVQRKITKEALLSCLGMSGEDKNCAAQRLVQYIAEEVSDKINDDVKKVFIAGGVIETVGLFDFIYKALVANRPELEVYRFDFLSNSSEFGRTALNFSLNERSTYAAAICAAIVAAKDIEVRTVLSLSYGTWSYSDNGVKAFAMLADKGTVLPPDESTFFSNQFSYTLVNYNSEPDDGFEGIQKDEMLSTVFSSFDIANTKGASEKIRVNGKNHSLEYRKNSKGEYRMLVGDSNTTRREVAGRVANLRTVINSDVLIYHNGKRVKVRKLPADNNNQRRILFREGILVDPNGAAVVKIRTYPDNFQVVVWYYDDQHGTWDTGSSRIIDVRELKMDFADGVFDVSSNQD